MERSVAVFPVCVDVGAGFGEEMDALRAGTFFGDIAAVLIGGGDPKCCIDVLVFEFEFWLVTRISRMRSGLPDLAASVRMLPVVG